MREHEGQTLSGDDFPAQIMPSHVPHVTPVYPCRPILVNPVNPVPKFCLPPLRPSRVGFSFARLRFRLCTHRLSPSRESFRELARRGNLIPVYREIIADMETPVSAFQKIDTGDHSFLFESVEKGGKFARYSFLGASPHLIFQARGKKITLREGDGAARLHHRGRPAARARAADGRLPARAGRRACRSFTAARSAISASRR